MREHRDKAQGLPDLLNYALFADDGIMLMKDGALITGWSYYGPDLNSSSTQDIEFLTASVNNTLCQLGDGWMLHGDLIRSNSSDYPAPERSYFPDPTSRLIDEERRQQYLAEGVHFESRYTLTITYLPPTDVESRFKKLFIQGENSQSSGWEKVLHIFKNRVEQLENSLSKLLRLQRLNSQALLTHLHTCITGLDHSVQAPNIPAYLDTLLGSKDLVGGIYPKIGDQYIRVIGFAGFPLETEPGLLSSLEQLPIAFRWSNRFIPLEPHTASKVLKIYRRNWLQKRHGLMGIIKEVMSQQERSGFQNRDALAMTEDADHAVEEAESGLVRYGYYTSVLMLMGEHPEDVDASAKLILKAIELRGFNGRIETINALEAYLGSLPGHGYQNIRKPLIHSLNFTDLLPLTSVWAGLETNPCHYYPPNSPPLFYAATTGSTPFRLNLHVNDVGHTLVVGPTGAGKSTLIGLMTAQQLRYPNAQIFIFDKGYSAYALCKALGGEHYDIAGEGKQITFFPLADIDQPNELDFACEWVESLLECQKISVNSSHRNEIRRALKHLSHQDKSLRTLTHFQSTIQDSEIKKAVEFYTLTGAMGKLLDADENKLGRSRIQVFEMKHLIEKGEAYTRPTLLYLFHQVEKQLRGEPTLLFIEEGASLLKGQFGARINVFLREKRKDNTAVVFLTQGLSEIEESPYKHVLLESCQTKLFLPNSAATTENSAILYRSIGLSDRQIEIIKQAVPKRDYYYTSTLGKRLIDLGLGKVTLSFIGINMSSETERREFDHFIEQNGEMWVYHWLKKHHQPEWADYWLTLYHHYKAGATINEENQYAVV